MDHAQHPPAPFRAQRLLALPLRLTPRALQRHLLEPVLNLALRIPLERGDLDFLDARHLRLQVTDAGCAWRFSLRGGRLSVLADGPAEVSIRGDLGAFAILAGRRADPDTLFFQRRLLIEGDTELGLAIKNLLDSLDPEDLPRGMDWLLQQGARLAASD